MSGRRRVLPKKIKPECAKKESGSQPSCTAMIVGKLVQAAAQGIKQTLTKAGLLGDAYTPEDFRAACREYIAARSELKAYARYEAPGDVYWDDEKYRGEAYAAFAWAVYVAEVTVDLTTYAVTV